MVRPIQDGTQRSGVRVYGKGKALTEDARLLQRVKDVLGLSEREIGELFLGCKRELVAAYLVGRARLKLTEPEKEKIAHFCAQARQALSLIEMEL